MLYQVYILPILDFCDVVWLPSNSTTTCHLERLHSSSLPSSDTFNLQFSLTKRCTFHIAVQVYKIVNKISPPYLHECFSFAVDVTGHPGRNVHRLFIPRVKTNYGKQSLAYRGAVIWYRLSIASASHGAKTLKVFRTLYCML